MEAVSALHLAWLAEFSPQLAEVWLVRDDVAVTELPDASVLEPDAVAAWLDTDVDWARRRRDMTMRKGRIWYFYRCLVEKKGPPRHARAGPPGRGPIGLR
jgi:hypothetical protein